MNECDEVFIFTMFDKLYVVNECDEVLHSRQIADSTSKHLKQLQHAAKRSSVKRREFGKLCLLLFDNKLDDKLFLSALAADMGFNDIDKFLTLINSGNQLKRRGRPLFDKMLCQKIYYYWIEYSELSTDRRNARHMVHIKKSKLDIAIADVVDSNVIECGNKKVGKFKAQRHIYNQPIRNLYKKFQKCNPMKIEYVLQVQTLLCHPSTSV